MPNTREKLIELIYQAQDNGIIQGNHVTHIAHISNKTVADHLIANGVTVQKWIPVTERLPEKTGLYMGFDTHFGVILAYYTTDKMMVTWEEITHWMPLPEPPKGE